MSYVKNGNVSIYYEAHGSGPAVLLTHGYAASARMWEPQVGPLSQKYKLILWEMRGHGRSDSPEDPAEYSEARTMEDMKL
ncbi:MAG: alpha/beta hydrolase, partial [Dehalococcoidia bacterium]|nr:alpha/beta hydrolase [Dehalococcoidia bacterium]